MRKMLSITILFVCILAPSISSAQQFFDNQQFAIKMIDGALYEGMLTGYDGLMQRATEFDQMAEKERDPQMRVILLKNAWYSLANALRMVTGLYKDGAASGPAKELASKRNNTYGIIKKYGKDSFGFDESATKKTLDQTIQLITSRVGDLKKGFNISQSK